MDDTDLQHAVLEELEFQPRVNARHVGVVASDGVVTLTGDVSRYSEKTAAVMAARTRPRHHLGRRPDHGEDPGPDRP